MPREAVGPTIELWCVLRTTATSTLPLAKSLSSVGYDVWTPVHVLQRRMPRTKAKVRNEVAMMPTYVFARAEHLPDLVELAVLPVKDHRDFRVFRHLNRFPLIADASLAPLRTEERKLQVVEKTKPGFVSGDRVRLTEGGFAGMSGTVESVQGKFASVLFPGYYGNSIKIASWHLLPDSVRDGDPEMGLAA